MRDGARRRLAFAAAAAAGLALAAALFLRLAPADTASVAARAGAFCAEATRQLDEDAALLSRTAERLQSSPEFSLIVDGGGAEVRPARLFSLLGDALPPARGFGAVFFDGASRPVAWAGEAAGLEAERGAATAGLVVSYHVTRVFVGWVSPRGENGVRGTLVVTRRYPTGILRPDLVEYLELAGGPTPLRLRLKASESRERFFTFFVEPAAPGVAEDDVSRRSALPVALVLAALAAALGVLARRPVAGLAAARFALLFGMPRAASGLFAPVPSAGTLFGLFATPADLLLTGLLAAAVAGAFARRCASRRPPAAAALLAPPLAAAPWLLGLWAGAAGSAPFDGVRIMHTAPAAFAEQTGLLSLAAAGVLLSATLLSPLARGRRLTMFAVLAVATAGGALAAAGAAASAPLGLLSALLCAAALAHRAVPSERDDLLARASTAVFVVAAATLLAAAGLADGSRRYVDGALERAESAAAGDAAGTRNAAIARWEERVGSAALAPWLPAGAGWKSSL